MHYIIYKTTNKINNKIYIGCHKTNDINDGYLGSGTVLKSAVKKYGKNNFIKEILFIYNNKEDMLAKEREIVTYEFTLKENVYNICVGGLGGFDHINNTGIAKFLGKKHTDETKKLIGNISRNRPVSEETKLKISLANVRTNESRSKKISAALKGKPLSVDHKKKISEAMYNSKHKSSPRPRNRYRIETPNKKIDITTNLVEYCEKRNLNYNYMKKGTKGYKIIEQIPLRDIV